MGLEGKVEAHGQVTLPPEILEEIGIEAGDTITFRTTGPHTVEMRVYPILTVQEIFERYPIEGPIDEAADRELWEAEAAKEVFERMQEGPMTDPHDASAGRFEVIAEELERAAKHCRTVAAHFRDRQVPRAGAHGFAAYGHMQRASSLLDQEAGIFASKAEPTTG